MKHLEIFTPSKVASLCLHEHWGPDRCDCLKCDGDTCRGSRILNGGKNVLLFRAFDDLKFEERFKPKKRKEVDDQAGGIVKTDRWGICVEFVVSVQTSWSLLP